MAKTITLSANEVTWIVQSLEDSIFEINSKGQKNWKGYIMTELEVRSLIGALQN